MTLDAMIHHEGRDVFGKCGSTISISARNEKRAEHFDRHDWQCPQQSARRQSDVHRPEYNKVEFFALRLFLGEIANKRQLHFLVVE